MFYTIYKITNKIDQKYYIGMHKTSNLDDGYMGSGKYLKSAIKKHGLENFEKEILFIFDNEQEMLDKEKELVVVCEQSYNLCEGGKGGFGYINNNSINNLNKDKTFLSKYAAENGRKNGSKNLKKLHDEGKIIPFDWTGKKHTEETKQKMRKPRNIGNNNSQFGTQWITNGIDNKKIKKDLDTIPDGWYRGRRT